jgi:hypothetical protein
MLANSLGSEVKNSCENNDLALSASCAKFWLASRALGQHMVCF